MQYCVYVLWGRGGVVTRSVQLLNIKTFVLTPGCFAKNSKALNATGA